MEKEKKKKKKKNNLSKSVPEGCWKGYVKMKQNMVRKNMSVKYV